MDESQKTAFLQRLKTSSASVTTISSRFEEVRHVAVLQSDVESSGHFYCVVPDKMALRYDKPAGDLLCINGDDLVMITQGNRMQTNARQNPSAKALQRLLMACLRSDIAAMGFGRKPGQIQVTDYPNTYEVTLTWGAGSSNPYQSIVLTYKKTDLSLQVLRMNEKNGNFATYKFYDTKMGQPIGASVFDTSEH
ncbi:MAG: outer membrane lipoprotein carrier protein LolA [Paludibacteraceae bacterium]|nr:outer membrane lipoprotein carrier protein LolA [Paludibacteraceae bacterium]